MQLAVNLGWLEATMLAGVRMIAFLVIAPPFSYNGFPMRVKGMLAIALAMVVAPRVTDDYAPLETLPFLFALVMQVLVGAVLGFLVYLVFAAIQSAGGLIDLFAGFQMAQAFDPQSMVNGAQFTRLFHMAALALLFSTDGYQLIIAGLMRTFNALPVGSGFDLAASTETIAAGVPAMFLAAVQIAGPLLLVLFLADVGIGLLTRVAPAINAFAMGFPLKILLTVVFAATLFIGLPRIVSAIVGQATDALLGVT